MDKKTDISEFSDLPEYNEASSDEYSHNLSSSEYNEGLTEEDGDGTGKTSSFLNGRKKKLISQVMAFTATATIAVSTVTIYPVVARTKVQDVSTSSAKVETHYMVFGEKESKKITYRLYDNERNRVIEAGDTSLTSTNLDFNNLEPGKTYKLQIIYEDKIIKTFTFNTLFETIKEEPMVKETIPETSPQVVLPPEPVTEPETIPETEPETVPEPETEPETVPETAPETDSEIKPDPVIIRETKPASIWDDGNAEITDEIHVVQMKENIMDYSNGPVDTSSILWGPSGLPLPEYIKYSYGSSTYPFFPILEQLNWNLPEGYEDVKMYLEWTETAEDGTSESELHRSEFSYGKINYSNVAAELSHVIRTSPGAVAFTPCYVYKGNLVKITGQVVSLPYLRVQIDFDSKGNHAVLDGLNSLTKLKLSISYENISYEKFNGNAWMEAESDFQTGHFDDNTDYRVTCHNIIITNDLYGASISIPDVTETKHHQ